MEKINIIPVALVMSSFLSFGSTAQEVPETNVLDEPCVLDNKGSGVYSCETSEFSIGDSTAPLDFTAMAIGENYPGVIMCEWKGAGNVKDHANSGGGYVLAKQSDSLFKLYKQSIEQAPNIIGVSFSAVEINGVSVSCRVDN